MTLSTDVYVLDPVDPHEVFRCCQQLLAEQDEQRRPVDQQMWIDEASTRPPGSRLVHNWMSQGLPAILDVRYRPDGPLRSQEDAEAEAAAHESYCDEDCDGSWHRGEVCYLNVDFDTAYAYRHNGMGCGDLHAWLVTSLGRWLDARGVRWRWRNEFTGEIHDRYDGLDRLGAGGAEASAWLQSTVLPAIAADVASSREVPR